MFELRTKVAEVDGIELHFKYPTVGDTVQIQSHKNRITKGQFIAMSLNDPNAVDLAEKIAVLSVCVRSTNKEKPIVWENVPEDKIDFVEKVYGEYSEWKNFFRRSNTESSREQGLSEGESKEGNPEDSVQEKIQSNSK